MKLSFSGTHVCTVAFKCRLLLIIIPGVPAPHPAAACDAHPPNHSTFEECYWTGLRQTRWARAVYAAGLGERWGSTLAPPAKAAAGFTACLRLPSLLPCALAAPTPRSAGCCWRMPDAECCRLHSPQPITLLPAAGREYVMPVRDIGRHGYKSDIKALCE